MDQAETDPDLIPKTSAESGKPPTMEDVATRAGVSRALVSIVFRGLPGASPENRERVRRAAAELGFRPDRRASLLGSKRTNLLGVAFGVGHEFHADLISDLYAAGDRHGLELVLSGVTERRSEQQAIAELLDFRCDAVLVLGPTLSATELAAYGSSTPVVVLASAVEAPRVEVIRTDDELGARLATEHLLSLGHRTIVHLDGGRAPGAGERRRGFLRTMQALDLTERARLIPGGLSEADGVSAAQRFLGQRSAQGFLGQRSAQVLLAGRTREPTAVFAFNDQCAIGFLQTVRDAGVRVPGDLSLIGYDDSRLAHASWTRLTTVGQNTAALAEGAVTRALARIRPADRAPASGPDGPLLVPPRPEGPFLVPPSLVIRSTTGRSDDSSAVPDARRL
ncbi:MAG TPA: LacI family DNA-binding transcriptional regulator [Microlunatus sp.]|nr:LacI family DNA-binding transcriptional regulator [Microlunatus sp.]